MHTVWFETAPCACGVERCSPEIEVVACPDEDDIAIRIADGRGKHSNLHLSPEWAGTLAAMLRHTVLQMNSQ